MIECKRDSNFIYQFDMEEGWFATVPVNNWDSIPEEDFRIYIGESFKLGVLTKELLEKLYNAYIKEEK